MSEFVELISDVESARKRVAKSKYIEAQKELSEETYPLIAAFIEACDERFAALEEELDEIAAGSGNVIQPDLAANLFSCFAFTRELCAMVKANSPTVEASLLIGNLEIVLNHCLAEVEANALPPEGNDGDGDDEEDAEEEESAATPLPIVAKPEPEAVQ